MTMPRRTRHRAQAKSSLLAAAPSQARSPKMSRSLSRDVSTRVGHRAVPPEALWIAAGLLAAGAVLVSAPTGWAMDFVIAQQELQFSKTDLSIHSGDTVVFTNNDKVRHNITIRNDDKDDAIDLGLQRPNTAVSYRFVMDGTYAVVCSIHPNMHIKIVVK
jgi:plastocyanin